MLLALLVIFSAGTLPADLVSQLATRQAVLHDVTSGRGSIERAFITTTELGELLLANREGDSLSRIEALTPRDFDELRREAPGMILNREEVLLAHADPKYFLRLARQYGTPADVEFFRNLLATYPDGVWASYVEQQADVSGCTEFDNGEIVNRYRGWLKFRARFPDAYESAVAKEIASIEEETASTCACGDEAGVVKALEEFVRTFPDSPSAPRARERIREIRSGKSEMRFGCTAG